MAVLNLTDIALPTEGRIWSEGGRIYVNATGRVIPVPHTAELTTAAQKQAAQTILGAWTTSAKQEWNIA